MKIFFAAITIPSVGMALYVHTSRILTRELLWMKLFLVEEIRTADSKIDLVLTSNLRTAYLDAVIEPLRRLRAFLRQFFVNSWLRFAIFKNCPKSFSLKP